MNGKSTYSAAALLIGSLLFVGCKTLHDNRDVATQDPVLGTTKPLSPIMPRSDLTERQICVETAKTVAEKGHAVEAIKLFEKAERLEPAAPAMDLELAPLYAQVGDSESAVARYRSAIAKGETGSEVINNLAWTLMESGQHQDALETIAAISDEQPENTRLQGTHAVILYKAGERDRAFEKFRGLHGESAAHHNLALLDLEAGNVDSAVEHAQLAASLPGCSVATTKLHETLQAGLSSATQLASASSDSDNR